jgi:hypothetical protein
MIRMQCTYPDGSTSEARYAMSLEAALEVYNGFIAAEGYNDNDFAPDDWDEPTAVFQP